MLKRLVLLPPKMGFILTVVAGLLPNMLVFVLDKLPKAGVVVVEVPILEVVLPNMLLPVELALPKVKWIQNEKFYGKKIVTYYRNYMLVTISNFKKAVNLHFFMKYIKSSIII